MELTNKIHKLTTMLEKTKKVLPTELEENKLPEIKQLLLALHQEERNLWTSVDFLWREGEISWDYRQAFRNLCSVPLGEVAELVDLHFMKQKDSQVRKNPELYGIDFLTSEGMEDTKFSPKANKDFFVEFWNRQATSKPFQLSTHFKEVEKGNKVWLRTINSEGCFRFYLNNHEWNKNQLVNAQGGKTKGWWVPLTLCEKVWEW